MSYLFSADCEWINPPPPSLPEERLRLAVFQRAVLDALAPITVKKGIQCVSMERAARRSALRYLFDTAHQDWPFSLSAVAEQMGMPADEVRRKVKEMVERAAQEAVAVRRFRHIRCTQVGTAGTAPTR
jgi:hypothetical protein